MSKLHTGLIFHFVRPKGFDCPAAAEGRVAHAAWNDHTTATWDFVHRWERAVLSAAAGLLLRGAAGVRAEEILVAGARWSTADATAYHILLLLAIRDRLALFGVSSAFVKVLNSWATSALWVADKPGNYESTTDFWNLRLRRTSAILGTATHDLVDRNACRNWPNPIIVAAKERAANNPICLEHRDAVAAT